MFQHTMQTLALVLGVFAAGAVQAAAHEKLTECVDLSEARSFKRGGSQYLYISDGGEHYRVSFASGDCGEMHGTRRLALQTGDRVNRVCPQDSKLVADGASCRVGGIEKLSAEDYQRLTRKRR
jgi:hypothetical protein